MTTFRIEPHTVIPGRVSVEVYADGALVACIYGDEAGRVLKVVSKYLDGVDYVKGSDTALVKLGKRSL